MKNTAPGSAPATNHAITARLYTPEEASQRLNPGIVPASWLRERARRREIPFVKIAGKYAFTDDQLTAIIRQFEQAPTGRPTAAPRRKTPKADDQPQGNTVTLTAQPPKRPRLKMVAGQ